MRTTESRRERLVFGGVRGLFSMCPAFLIACAVVAQEGGALRTQQGRVVDVLGAPVPAAKLEVVLGDTVLVRGVSDGEGVYQLRAKALPGARLRVSARGKAEMQRLWGGLSQLDVQNIVLEDGCSVTGVVLDQRGAVVANATVILAGGESLFAVHTDAEGQYELPSVPMRKLHMRAWGVESFAEQTIWPRQNARCDFILPRRTIGRRRIRVQGLPNEALPAARLEIMSYDCAVQRDGGRLRLLPDGTAEFLPGDTSLVRLVVPGYEARPRGWIVSPGGVGELVFRATPFGEGTRGALLRGRVVGPERRGIEGARLVVEDRLFAHAGTAVTDDDGAFQIHSIVPQDAFCRIGIRLGDWQFADMDATISSSYSWTETEANGLLPYTLEVQLTSSLHSQVVCPDGNRFAFGEVFIAPSHTPQALCATLSADRVGSFEVSGLAEGEYMIAAVSDRGELAACEVEVERGKRLVIGEWRRIATGIVSGTVLGENREPMPGVVVRLVSPELRNAEGEPMIGRPDARVRTDRAGMFRCQGLHAGEWRVELPHEAGVDSELVDVVAGKTASLGFTLSR